MTRKLALFAVLGLIFTIPWETAITVSSLGTLTRLIGFGAAGLWIASVLVTGKIRKFHAYLVAVFCFVFFNVASIYWTFSYDLTVERIKTYIQLAILTWFLWDLLNTSGSLRLAMQVFIFGAYLAIASQLINLATGKIISTYEQGRFSGAGQNANEFSLILSLSLPLAWHLAITQEPGRSAVFLKIVNIVFIPLALIATFLTASRTSLVTDIPGLVYIAATIQGIKPVYRMLVIILIFTMIVVIAPVVPEATVSRLMTIGDSISGNDLGGRVMLWNGSFRIFSNHPFLGIGSNALSAPGQLGSYAHNTFLSIMAELGLVGFILFSGILLIVIYEAFKQPKPYTILWLTVISVWLIGTFTLTWEYTKPTWFFLTLVVISAGVFNNNHQPLENSSASAVALASSVVRTI